MVDRELFNVHSEVPGSYFCQRPFNEKKSPRIDRILVPTKTLLGIGWELGPVGVELKASGKKLGSVISQIANYGNAVFSLPHNFNIHLDQIFLFPCGPTSPAVISIMAQNRIGKIEVRSNELAFKLGETIVLKRENEKWIVHPNPPDCGRKLGSR